MIITDEELQQLKAIELEILDEFVRICDKHSIKYFLSDGTCLGAARHKGFIPWDDDIDVSMLRSDYEKFCEVCKTDLADAYILQNFHTEKNCGLVFAKIRKKGTIFSEDYSQHLNINQGVWIDIFPYDNVPDNRDILLKQTKKVDFLKNLYIVKSGYKMPPNMTLLKKIAYYGAKLLCVFTPFSTLITKLDKEMTRFNNQNCKNIYPYGGAYGIDREMLPARLCTETTTVEFEGNHYLTYKNYEEYLTLHYGNYLELPPENERVAGVHRIVEFKASVNQLVLLTCLLQLSKAKIAKV